MGLRSTARLAVERRQGGGGRVGRIGLAALAAGLAVGADHLDHLDPLGSQVAGQSGPVTAGALHTNLDQPAMPAHPGQHRLVAAGGGRELLGAQHPADGVHHGGDVHLGMGVHTTGDGLCWVCNPGHVVLFRSRCRWGWRRPGQADRALHGHQVASGSGSYQVTARLDQTVVLRPGVSRSRRFHVKTRAMRGQLLLEPGRGRRQDASQPSRAWPRNARGRP